MADTDIWLTVQPYIFIVVSVLCIWYLSEVIKAKYEVYRFSNVEGFEDSLQDKKKEDLSLYTWVDDPQKIYDDFYVGVYDQLTRQEERTQAKVGICVDLWKSEKEPISSWTVLDAGCGTGFAACTFAKLGAGNVIALDQSVSMIQYGQKKTTEILKLTSEQKTHLRWRQDSLINSAACGAGECTHIVVFYFTFYYMNDQEEFLRHLNFWAKPGAKMALEVVNRYKFDPILESASPFLGFSLQKYSKERVRKSHVTFDKFDYEAEFQLTDSKGEFYETFRFKKGNTVRRQKHVLNMPEIKQIVEMAKRAGWVYEGSQDLLAIGFEYAYLLVFHKN